MRFLFLDKGRVKLLWSFSIITIEYPYLFGIMYLTGSNTSINTSKAEWFGLYHGTRNEYLAFFYQTNMDSMEGILVIREQDLLEKAEDRYQSKVRKLYEIKLKDKK